MVVVPRAIRVRTSQGWEDIALVGRTGYDTAPIGSVLTFTGKTVPQGWALADGARYTQVQFPQGYDFATAEQTAGNPLWTARSSDTSFTVPDLRDRFLLNQGATYAFGARAGEANHILTAGESGMPAHQTGNSSSANANYPWLAGGASSWASTGISAGVGNNFNFAQQNMAPPGGITYVAHDHSHAVGAQNAGSAHNNMPPYVAIALIVKLAGVSVLDSTIQGPPGANGTAGGQAFQQAIGDGSSTNFTVNHNLHTNAVTVTVFRTAAPYDEVEVDVERSSVDQVTIRTAPTVPASGEYQVIVSAAGTVLNPPAVQQPPIPVVTALPANPSNNQEIYLRFTQTVVPADAVMLTWHLQWDSSNNCWWPVGEPAPIFGVDQNVASFNFQANVWGNMNANDPSVTIPFKGEYRMEWGCGQSYPPGVNNTWVGLQLAGVDPGVNGPWTVAGAGQASSWDKSGPGMGKWGGSSGYVAANSVAKMRFMTQTNAGNLYRGGAYVKAYPRRLVP